MAFLCCPLVFECSVGKGVFVIGLSQISFFSSHLLFNHSPFIHGSEGFRTDPVCMFSSPPLLPVFFSTFVVYVSHILLPLLINCAFLYRQLLKAIPEFELESLSCLKVLRPSYVKSFPLASPLVGIPT